MRKASWGVPRLTGLATLVLIAAASPAAAQTPESPDPIKIANFDWTSAVLNTKIPPAAANPTIAAAASKSDFNLDNTRAARSEPGLMKRNL